LLVVPHIDKIDAAKPVNNTLTKIGGTNHKSKATQKDKQRLQLKGLRYNIFGHRSGMRSTSIKWKANKAAVIGMIKSII
jgi:hypothetical protein